MVNRELLHELDAANTWFAMAVFVSVCIATVFLIVLVIAGEDP